MLKTRITKLFGIDHPIVQGGMRWVARAELAAAVAEGGGIGFISSHMHADPEDLRREIQRVQSLTQKPFGVNLTVLPVYKGTDYDAYVRIIIEMGVRFVETSGSNPARYIDAFKRAGITVVHKCVSPRFAVKAEQLGADGVIVNSFECGGHPGEEDIPALILIPSVVDKVKIPVLAAGGQADGRGLAAALALGAEGVVYGTRFMATQESPLHPNIKQRMLEATERDTVLVGRAVGDSQRVLKNALVSADLEMEKRPGITYTELLPLIGAARWTQAAAKGDPEDGAIPSGMAVGLIHDIPRCVELIPRIVRDAEDIIRGRMAGMLA